MQTYGTGMRFRRESTVRQAETTSRGEVSPVEPLPPLHLSEVPPSMYPDRERLASVWAGLTPPKSGTQSTGPKKRSRTQKNTKTKGRGIGKSR